MGLKDFFDELLKVYHDSKYATCLIKNLYDMELKEEKSIPKNNTVLNLMTKHFDLVVRYCRNDFTSISIIIDDLYGQNENLEFFFRKNLCKILGIARDRYDLEYLINSFSDNWNLDINFVEECLNRDFDKILQSYSFSFVYSLVSSGIYFTKENRDKLGEYLRNNKEKYISMLLFSQCGKEFASADSKDLKNIVSVVTMLVDEVLKQEQMDYIDIEKLSGGCFSDVIGIGNKVIKVGREKGTYHMPYDKGMIEPIIRVNLFDYSNIHGTIEAMERVDTKGMNKFSIEDLYGFYKEARKRGVVYADLKFDNVGILVKDNKIHWNEPLANDMRTRGLISTGDDDCLKTGSMVCFDTDFLYTEDAYKQFSFSKQDLWNIPDSLSPLFEDRYQKELSGSYSKKNRDIFYREVGEALQKKSNCYEIKRKR